MTAVEMLNDDVYIGGESDCNIFTLRRNAGKNQRAVAYSTYERLAQFIYYGGRGANDPSWRLR